ncbi:hypothetical protein RD792_005906 [Penstemon davidsonii]|uniref:C2H2-type domain-containing protein n=1 Tax=Penstemon davidsonii TaxID=160366 RepID=A0ABR0DDY9_9LAMI|nr:hypothetical protein RD792_005906 [Penstemon davidsonii]
MMISSEILEEFSSNDRHQVIVKRKRSKRLIRPSSSATTTSSTSTEEDEDMAANCLILLARGGGGDEEEEEIKTQPENINKFNSRKFTEMISTATNGKVGIYVYECKTCNRSFPSFQALGGHRASHKKPKTTTADGIDRKKSPTVAAPSDDRDRLTNSTIAHESKRKIHECLICGSEFGSGQALGGHMRRHRSEINKNNNNARIGASIDNDTTSSHDVSEKSRNMLALDLNLPAPPEEEATFHPRLVFSAVKLVDCHY